MKLKIGTWIDKTADSGEMHDRYLIFGRAIKDAEFKPVGAKGTSLLTIVLSPGKEEDLVRVKLWGYDAMAYNGLKKGTMLLLDAYEDKRDWEGKTYTDYIPLNVMDVSEKPGRGSGTGKRTQKEVEPQDPMAGFVDFTNHDDLPF